MKSLKFKNSTAGGTIGLGASIKAGTTFFAHYGLEAVMSFTLSGALVFGPFYGFLIGAGIMGLADLMVGLVGLWTLYTAFAYGLVGFLAGLAGRFKKEFSRIELAGMAFILTIIFDAIAMTGFALQFHIPMSVAIMNQIPVTLLHTVGNTLLAFIFVPAMIKILKVVSDPSLAQGFFERLKTVGKQIAEGTINLKESSKIVIN
jgi:uncharacterized membrane protein